MDLSDPDRFLEETNILWLVVSRHKDYKPTSHNQFSTWSYILVTQSFWRVFFSCMEWTPSIQRFLFLCFFFLCFFDVWLNPGQIFSDGRPSWGQPGGDFFPTKRLPPKMAKNRANQGWWNMFQFTHIEPAECDMYTRTRYFSHEEQVGNEACDRQLFFSFRVFKVGEIVNISCFD